jgi:hypothetical protein
MEWTAESLWPGRWPPLRPALQALLPGALVHGVNLGIGEHHATPSPQCSLPAKAYGG